MNCAHAITVLVANPVPFQQLTCFGFCLHRITTTVLITFGSVWQARYVAWCLVCQAQALQWISFACIGHHSIHCASCLLQSTHNFRIFHTQLASCDACIYLYKAQALHLQMWHCTCKCGIALAHVARLRNPPSSSVVI